MVADQLIRADLLVTSGGISQGDYDLVKAVMPELGACEFVQVAMQPGKPQGFGLIGDDRVPMIMLPGNPVSSYVSFEAFVRPVIRKLMGARPYARIPVQCEAAHAMTSIPGRQQFARGIVSFGAVGPPPGRAGRWPRLTPAGGLARANALVHAAGGDGVRRRRRGRRGVAARRAARLSPRDDRGAFRT